MADTRTLRQKLEAMAAQDASPQEAEIARAKLALMGAAAPPIRPPTVVGAAAPMPPPNNGGSNHATGWLWINGEVINSASTFTINVTATTNTTTGADL